MHQTTAWCHLLPPAPTPLIVAGHSSRESWRDPSFAHVAASLSEESREAAARLSVCLEIEHVVALRHQNAFPAAHPMQSILTSLVSAWATHASRNPEAPSLSDQSNLGNPKLGRPDFERTSLSKICAFENTKIEEISHRPRQREIQGKGSALSVRDKRGNDSCIEGAVTLVLVVSHLQPGRRLFPGPARPPVSGSAAHVGPGSFVFFLVLPSPAPAGEVLEGREDDDDDAVWRAREPPQGGRRASAQQRRPQRSVSLHPRARGDATDDSLVVFVSLSAFDCLLLSCEERQLATTCLLMDK
jgi:hypothetical protein